MSRKSGLQRCLRGNGAVSASQRTPAHATCTSTFNEAEGVEVAASGSWSMEEACIGNCSVARVMADKSVIAVAIILAAACVRIDSA